jgi:dihydrolipoamide dehydrogenase
MLDLEKVAKELIVIGGGVIGLELGSVHARLGAKVNVIEFADSIIPTMDKAVSKELTKVLKKEGFKFNLNHKVQNVQNTGKGVIVTALNKKGEEVKFEGDYCLVAVGRKPFTKGLGLENAGVKIGERGMVEVDDNLQTNVPGIYAIGDVVRGAMLAHKAEEEGVFVAEFMAGEKPHLNYNLIPGVVYTWPEVAAVGKTEEELIAAGVKYKVGSFPVKALGRARASMDIMGLVKILADAETDEVLGVHMVSARAADMIMEAVTAMEYRATAEDMARICHPHPTYTEATKEAALAATGDRALHI